jgi:hypothetical protein
VPVKFSELLPDTREISRGLIVNQAGWLQVLENNQQAFITAFVQRQRFTSAYPLTMTPAQFVDLLFTPDPDFAGYNFWLTKLNQFGGSFESAEIVKAFILSGEYRRRFGP